MGQLTMYWIPARGTDKTARKWVLAPMRQSSTIRKKDRKTNRKVLTAMWDSLANISFPGLPLDYRLPDLRHCEATQRLAELFPGKEFHPHCVYHIQGTSTASGHAGQRLIRSNHWQASF